MVPLLWCALADTGIVNVPSNMVFIHEWGVIEVDEFYLEAEGCPDGWVGEYGYFQDYPENEVTAPVVYFHGAECSGTFSVEIHDGLFTTLLPYPDSVAHAAVPGLPGSDVYTAVWEDLRITKDPPAITEETETTRGPYRLDCFSWAVPFWREVPANTVYYPATDFEDVFLYYESTINNPEMFMGDYYNHRGEALVFFSEDGELTCVKVTVPDETDARGETLSDLEIMTELCGWAHNGLKSAEITALWKTWRPLLRTRCELEGQTLMLFPLTVEQEEMVSTLRFVPTENRLLVSYERLLLGLGAI